MDVWTRYAVSTYGYGLFVIIGLVGAAWSLIVGRILLFVVFVAIFLVAMDNFFCGTRFRKAGRTCTTHYVMPPLFGKHK